MTTEEWRPVVGWGHLYEVSNQGRVRSLDRMTPARWGLVRRRGKILKLTPTNSGYPAVSLSESGRKTKLKTVHRMVAEAFIPNPENLPDVLHWDDVSTHNTVENLRWGTQADNNRDKQRLGTNNGPPRKEHCPQEHPYSGNNLYISPSGSRHCRTCLYTQQAARRARGLPGPDPRHGTPRGSWAGCKCGPCKAAGSKYTMDRAKEREGL